jgi:predicted Zn-dependent peptidase
VRHTHTRRATRTWARAARLPGAPDRLPYNGRRPSTDPQPGAQPMPTPVVQFIDERLANGLRLIVAEDHLAPVVAVNIWYDVGSKHEQPGKTGFAHLFEHVMFQGSRNVGKAEHIALIQAAGGTMNGTTWLDRTNYFETLPSHQLELALWLEADRMGTLLDALSQENLDNQREVVKNEKRWSYDNRPYGSWNEKLQAHLFPEGHPYHHPTIGSMEDLDAASLEDVQQFFRTYYAPNNAVLTVVGDVEPDQVRAWTRRYFGGIEANPDIPPLPDLSLPTSLGGERRETVPDKVPLPRVYFGFRAPAFGDTRLDALDVASQILAGGKGSRLHKRLVRQERIAQDVALFTLGFVGGASITAGWATVRPGVEVDRVERTFHEELERIATEEVTDDELARAKALIESDELGAVSRVEERADRLSMYATLFDDPDLINRMLPRYLAVTPQAIREVAAQVLRPDNRVVLTYVPERPPADDEQVPEPDVALEDEEVAA